MRCLCTIIIVSLFITTQALAENEKTIYGFVEKVALSGSNSIVSAKLDTGAKSASIYAINIKSVEIKGKPYISFMVPTKKGRIPFICEYAGKVNIKLRETEAKHFARKNTKRHVVKMKMIIGKKEREIYVNLSNRKRFFYPLLLGREAINAFDGIVDPSRVFIAKHASSFSIKIDK